MIDYARPTMRAEDALKKMHFAFIDGRMEEAEEMALEAIKQVSLAYVAVKYAQCQKAINS